MSVLSNTASRPASETDAEITPARVAIIVAFALFVWFCVAMLIRYGGPGQFSGREGLITYAITAAVTWPLNWLTRKIAGLSARKMVVVMALTLTTTTSLEGVVMRQFPGFYGGDVAEIGSAAIWLLWAVGLGLGFACLSAFLASRRS
jgi:hypothetical protein